MSRGCGRLMRRILQVLETTPERSLDRVELERVLVGAERFDPSNVLRAIKGLARKHRVGFTDRRHKGDSLVSLPRKARRISDDVISVLLTKIRSGR